MFGLAGCGFGVLSPSSIQDIEGTDFNSYLAGEYQRRTAFEAYEEKEWRHAGRLAAKGKEGSGRRHGSALDAFGLECPCRRSCRLWKSGYSRLMAALDSGGP